MKALDAFGNRVVLPKSILLEWPSTGSEERTDSIETVIQNPALMLTSCSGNPSCCTTEPCENHYYRLINSTDTLLISACRVNDEWIAYNYTFNPTVQQLAPYIAANRVLKPIGEPCC